jgi:undecaprenyl-diphosphatase
MKKKSLYFALVLIMSFVIWTILVSFMNVRPIGPNNSLVGFSYINEFVRNIIGSNMKLYIITDWLGLVPIGFCFGFGVLGLVQWVKRRKFIKVDYSIFIN